MTPTAADRNLLFGILAVQMDFISRDALIAAMHAWVLDKKRSLGSILGDHGALADDARNLLDAMVDKHLELHGGEAAQSLAALAPSGAVCEALADIGDRDVQASLPLVSRGLAGQLDAATAATLVGTPTSAGTRFKVLRPHAKGGLGEVFVAHDVELHREVALKEIQARHADDRESRARFVLEAEITGGLEHPGVVPVYGLGFYENGRPFYAMRFIKGDSLKDAIERFHSRRGRKPELSEGGRSATPVPSDKNLEAKSNAAGARSGGTMRSRRAGRRDRNSSAAVEFRKLLGRFIDVCDAIEYAHSRGVLHR
ncbi:MAG: protein kinase, partial [Pirellulales bacterium]